MRARLDARERSLQATRSGSNSKRASSRSGAIAVEAVARERTHAIADSEAALQAWEQRLRAEAERLLDERTEHGTASQDAFALMAELESGRRPRQRRETELQEAQARLQRRGDGDGDDRTAPP